VKPIITQLLDDFYERELPRPVHRNQTVYQIEGKADVFIGMRRCGKTWFGYQCIERLLKEGISRDQILYLNFEDERLLGFEVEHFQLILDVYFARFPENKNKTCYFFFDEIQKIDQWELFIRRLLDTETIKVLITGSSSKLLSRDIASSLRGRSMTTEIFPLDFREYLYFHDIFPVPPQTFGSKNSALLRNAVSRYFRIGGFPEIQNIEGAARGQILQGYIDTVLLKDIIERHNITNITALKFMVRTLMHTAGNKFSINKFYHTLKSMAVKCTKNRLYDYMDYLTDAFVFYRVPIHTRSEKARMINPVKLYVIDTGLINAMTFHNSDNRGHLLENLVFMHLRRNQYQVEYVSTRKGIETDFFARHPITGEAQLIQVCWDMANRKTFDREVKGLKAAMEELDIPNGTIVTWDDESSIDDTVSVIPVWKWMLREK
jgi:predicted AAA+ superfamily ATPase